MNKTIIALAFSLSFFLQPCSAMEQKVEPVNHEIQIPPIHKAVEDRKIEAINALIAQHGSLNQRDDRQQTALHRAVRMDNLDIAQLLLENRAEASLQDNEGNTPLHIAVRQNAVGMAILLMTFNATVNTRNNEGKTVLHIAATSSCDSLVDLCLQGGASPDIRIDAKDGKTAFEIAKQKGDKLIMSMMKEASKRAQSEFEKGTFTSYAKQGVFKATEVILRDPQIQKDIMSGLLIVARGTLRLAARGAVRSCGYVQSKCIIL